MLGDQDYKIVVHLPGKVKKVNSDNATIIDKTTVELVVPMDDLFDSATRIDLDIEFKGLKK